MTIEQFEKLVQQYSGCELKAPNEVWAKMWAMTTEPRLIIYCNGSVKKTYFASLLSKSDEDIENELESSLGKE